MESFYSEQITTDKLDTISIIKLNFEYGGVIVPRDCIEEVNLSVEHNTEDNISWGNIIDIKLHDNGNIKYEKLNNQEMYPLQRIHREKDIVSILIIYEDSSELYINIDWEDLITMNSITEEERMYHIPEENKNQITSLINYNTLHILINPQEYCKTKKAELENLITEYSKYITILENRINTSKVG